MPDVRITTDTEVQVWCGTCNKGICDHATGGNDCITVEACSNCLETSKQEGYTAGHHDGYDEGLDEGSKGS